MTVQELRDILMDLDGEDIVTISGDSMILLNPPDKDKPITQIPLRNHNVKA